MTNIYDQTYEMELTDLQDMLVDIQNTLIVIILLKMKFGNTTQVMKIL